jgi:hypothetical protein
VVEDLALEHASLTITDRAYRHTVVATHAFSKGTGDALLTLQTESDGIKLLIAEGFSSFHQLGEDLGPISLLDRLQSHPGSQLLTYAEVDLMVQIALQELDYDIGVVKDRVFANLTGFA